MHGLVLNCLCFVLFIQVLLCFYGHFYNQLRVSIACGNSVNPIEEWSLIRKNFLNQASNFAVTTSVWGDYLFALCSQGFHEVYYPCFYRVGFHALADNIRLGEMQYTCILDSLMTKTLQIPTFSSSSILRSQWDENRTVDGVKMKTLRPNKVLRMLLVRGGRR